MAKWTVINGGSAEADQIGKDGVFYNNLNLTWLPSDVCAVQSANGETCEIEKGDPATGSRTQNDIDVATNTLSWWSNVSTTWQAAYDAEQAAIAAAAAAAAEAEAEAEGSG